MTENNKDRYQEIYQEALKAYPQDNKSTVQRKACNLWNIVKEKEKQDKPSTNFKDTLANLRKECLQSSSKETPAQNKLQTELEETNDEPACYACIRERTGLSDEYKKRAEALT